MLFCDNKGAITMAFHPANKPDSRHIYMRIHFFRQHVELGDVATTFTPTPDMVADLMTKQTQRLTHERHCRRAFGKPHAPIPPTNDSCACSHESFVSAHPLSLASCCLVYFCPDLFNRERVIHIRRISRPVYSGIPRNIYHRRHGPSM